jgi:hypothetical protein
MNSEDEMRTEVAQFTQQINVYKGVFSIQNLKTQRLKQIERATNVA